MTPAFWRNKRVFLTGHTGFKGSWLCLLLNRFGARLQGYALPPPQGPSLFTAAGIHEVVDSWVGDVRDLGELKAALQSFQPEIVLHLAAQSLVRHAYEDPVGTFATNVMGTTHVLEAARLTRSVRVIVNVSSDKCYENRERPTGYSESDALGGHDPYSASKGAAEIVVGSYLRSFGADENAPRMGSGRAGNVIGGGDWAKDRLLPDCMRAFSKGETVHVRHPAAVRPWQYVLEPLAGYLVLAERLATTPSPTGGFGSWGWNFGPAPSDNHPVGAVVERGARLWGDGAKWEHARGPHLHEAMTLNLDSQRALTELGWRPRTDLATALERTVAWYKDHHQGGDARRACERDLDHFLELS